MSWRVGNFTSVKTSRFWWGWAALALLGASAAAGFELKSRILGPYGHDEALDFMGVITAFLTTTAAIVMGLLINAAKSFVDTTADHWAMYAAQLLRLDQCLRNFGPETEPMRRELQSFTAAVLANTWRTEPAPHGVRYPEVRTMTRERASLVLSDTLNDVKMAILRLRPTDPVSMKMAADCFDQYQEFARARWSLLLGPQKSVPSAFLRVLVFWLMIIFICFGLRAPTSPIAIVMIGLSATTLSSMLFTIVDMVNPYDGIYDISSDTMHDVLGVMQTHNPDSADAAGRQSMEPESLT